MKKTLFILLLAGSTAMAMTACSKGSKSLVKETAEATTLLSQEETSQAQGGQEESRYDSSHGWSVRYDPQLFKVDEDMDQGVRFEYLEEAKGSNTLTISYVEGKQPEEAMTEITDTWGDGESIERTEGFFPGTTDKWGYWRSLISKDDSGLMQTLIGGEYNGGVLLFDIKACSQGDDEKDMNISDSISAIIDSIEYENFEDQTMYSYIPGKYVQDVEDEYIGADGKTQKSIASYSIMLNKDHTGSMNLQDSVDITWGSIELMTPDQSYEYTIEGDTLMVNMDGNWLEFTRTNDNQAQ